MKEAKRRGERRKTDGDKMRNEREDEKRGQEQKERKKNYNGRHPRKELGKKNKKGHEGSGFFCVTGWRSLEKEVSTEEKNGNVGKKEK